MNEEDVMEIKEIDRKLELLWNIMNNSSGPNTPEFDEADKEFDWLMHVRWCRVHGLDPRFF